MIETSVLHDNIISADVIEDTFENDLNVWLDNIISADVIEATFENDLNFLLFSEDFSVALDFLTLQYEHNKGHFVGMFCKQTRKAHHMLTLLLTTYIYTLLSLSLSLSLSKHL